MTCGRCGTQHEVCQAFCTRCGQSLAAPRPETAFRDGPRLVVPVGVTLPPYCVRCGERADHLLFNQYSWSPPALLLHLIPLGGFIAIASARRMHLAVPICSRHHAMQRRAERIGLFCFLGAPVFGYIVGTHTESWEWGLGVAGVLLLAAIIAAVMTRDPLSAARINETQGWFKGAGEGLLMRLPTAPPRKE